MKITLCGSTRFHERFQELNEKLTAMGHVVYTVAFARTPGQRQPTPEEKEILDLVHLRKIAESEAIIVIGMQEDGSFYIGDSTRREILWASINDKQVMTEKGLTYGGKLNDVSEFLLAQGQNFEYLLEGIRNSCKPREPKMVQEGGEA